MKAFVPLALFALLLTGAAPQRRGGSQNRGGSSGHSSGGHSAGRSGGGGGAQASPRSGGGSGAQASPRSGGGDRGGGAGVSRSGGGDGGRAPSGRPSGGGPASGGRAPSGGDRGGGRVFSGGDDAPVYRGRSGDHIVRLPGGDQSRSGGGSSDVIRHPSDGFSRGGSRAPAGSGTPDFARPGGNRGHEGPVFTPYDDRSRGSGREPGFDRFVTKRPNGSFEENRGSRGGSSTERGTGGFSRGRSGSEPSRIPGSDVLGRHYRDRYSPAPAETGRRGGVVAERPRGAAPREKIDYGSPLGRRTAGEGGVRRSDSGERRGWSTGRRVIDTERRAAGERFLRDPVASSSFHWRNNSWRWGWNWWRDCHSSFSWCAPRFFDPWWNCSWGWNVWWNWSWGRSRWVWGWGSGWCDPFWVAGWWWPWSASVVYVPQTTVYVDPPQTVYVTEDSGAVDEPAADAGGAPGGARAGESLTEKHVRLADLYFKAGRYDKAVEHYLRATEYAPEQASLYLMLSDGLFAIGDYHFAAYAVRKAVEKDPSLVEARVNKREFYSDPADFETHLAQLEAFVADHGNDGDAWLLLGVNRHFSGSSKEAREAFARAKQTLPADRCVDLFLAAVEVREAEAAAPAVGAETQPGGEPRS